MWTERVLRWVVGVVVGAILIWWGVTEHLRWLYVAGVLVVGFVPASLLWVVWGRWRPGRRIRSALAGFAVLLVAVPSIGLPWLSYRSQLASHAEWSVEAGSPNIDGQFVVDDRAYLLSDLGLTVVDHRTGEVVAEASIDSSSISVGSGGTIYEQPSDAPVIAYDEFGTELWQREGNAVAATAETTVVRTCPRPIGAPVCRYIGVETATGAPQWTRRVESYPDHSIWVRQAELPSFNLGHEGWWPTLLPEVAVLEERGPPGDLQVVDPDTGDTLQRFDGGVGVAGDLVVHAEMSGETCVVRSYRDGQEAWASEPIPRGDCPGPMDFVGSRLYFHTEDARTITLDLDDGTWRRWGQIHLGATDDVDFDEDLPDGVGDDDVIVYRDGTNEIFAVDVATGEELWRRETAGDRAAGLTVANGAVTVLTPPETHNPFVPKEIADKGYVETVLDARTGEVTGSWMGDWSSLWTSLPVGPGRALLVADGQLFPVGRDD